MQEVLRFYAKAHIIFGAQIPPSMLRLTLVADMNGVNSSSLCICFSHRRWLESIAASLGWYTIRLNAKQLQADEENVENTWTKHSHF